MLSQGNCMANKTKLIFLIPILILLASVSCAKYISNERTPTGHCSSQTSQAIEPGPLPRNYQSLVLTHLQRTLPDYYDLQHVVFGNCAVHSLPIDAYGLKAGHQVWACEVMFNSPDHPEDPTALQYHIVYFRMGKIILLK